jgi:hypothetical protein
VVPGGSGWFRSPWEGGLYGGRGCLAFIEICDSNAAALPTMCIPSGSCMRPSDRKCVLYMRPSGHKCIPEWL